MLFVLLFILYATSSRAVPVSDESRIILGEDAQRHQFPHMASFQFNESHRCGAAVLSPYWVITAAHCCGGNIALCSVAVGLLDRNETHPDNQRIYIEEVIKHPQFELPKYDVAMLKLSSPLVFNDAVQPIKLPQADQEFTGNVRLSGWGRINGNIPYELPNRLQCVDMDLISLTDCNKINKEVNSTYPWKVADTLVCALPRKPKQSGCHHDSGSPLIQGDILVGIVHGGDTECGQTLSKPSPNIFARVSSFIKFINEIMTT